MFYGHKAAPPDRSARPVTSGDLREDLTGRLLAYCNRNQLSLELATRLIAGEIALADLLMIVEGFEADELAAEEVERTG